MGILNKLLQAVSIFVTEFNEFNYENQDKTFYHLPAGLFLIKVNNSFSKNINRIFIFIFNIFWIY